MDNEYVMIFGKRAFRVYGMNKQLAIQRFKEACKDYACTDNQVFRDHWLDIIEQVTKEDYIIFKSDDYVGVREIL